VDSSGNGLTGTLNGATWVTTGKYGKALSFNGTSNWVAVADNTLLHLTSAMTLEAWVYPTAASTGWSTAVLKERGTTGLAYALYATDGAAKPPAGYIDKSGTDYNATGTSVLPLNTWSHLAATYSGSAVRLYVNGTQVASRSVSGTIASSTAPLRIGGNNVWGEYFKGLIDEVRVYNTALTASQITTDMNTPVVSGPDTTPPTASVTAPTNNALVRQTVTVSADCTDNVAVASVQFQVDGQNLGSPVTATPYAVSWNTTAVTDGTHTLTAVATDTSGNTGSSTVTVSVDNTLPTESITAPATGTTVSGTTAVTASAADNVAVASVQFQLDGQNLGSPDTTAPYTVNWDTTTASNAIHQLTAVAKDTAGNQATSAAVTVTVSNVDATPPTVSMTAPATNAAVHQAVTVSANAADNVAVAGVQFYLDGNPLGAEDMTAPYSVSWDTTTVADGSHTLSAAAWDTSGNRSVMPDPSVAVTVDNAAPTVSVTNPAGGSTVSGSTAVTANATDNVGVVGVQFKLDGQNLGAEDTTAPYLVAWDTTTAGNGTHQLTAVARDAAGNTTTSAVATVTVNNLANDPAQVGQWSSVMNWPLVAINMVLLDNGKVLMWDGGPDCIGSITDYLWDPSSNTFTSVNLATQPEFRDIFCSGQSVLADGRVLVVGGHECVDPNYTGSAIANVFDPATNQWTFLPDMSSRRWYPTATTLSDGRVLVTAGSVHNNSDYSPIPEVYDPVSNTFTTLSGASQSIPNYPFVFDLPDGRVLVAGSDEAKMATYVLNVATQSWSVVDPTVLDAGSAVMYLPGKVMKAGSSYRADTTAFDTNPAAGTTYVLDMTQASPAWHATGSLAYPRAHHNLTILADGTVLATGGTDTLGGYDPSTAVFPAERWSPVTQTWSTMASMATPRMYHSTALLLPDGRVLSAGGGHNYVNNANYFSSEIYSPPYLFKGARPTITTSPSTLTYGSSFFVGTPDGASIASVSLVRNGAVTHEVNMDQRYVPLSFSQTSGGLTVQAPADANTAPPGYYMLFIVNSNGVPSVAPFIRLPAGYEDSQPPTSPAGLTAVAASFSTINLSWTASTDNVGVIGYNVYRSTTSGFTPTAANLIGQTTGTAYSDGGLGTGTFYYQVIARDAAGNTSPPSNEASATVTGDTTPPTVSLTAPANNATVSGSVAVSATASDDVGVVGVQFKLDGANLGVEDTTSPYSVNWATTAASNGGHTLTAVARDAAGHTTTSAAVTVTVNNTATGLVGAWGFEDGSGTTTADVSGHGLSGTISNATWTTAGKYGDALSFNGSNSWVTVADNTLLHLTTGMTIEAWVKPAAASADWTAAVIKERGTTGLAYALYATDGAGKPPAGYINKSGTDYEAAAASVLPLNTWTHLAVTYDGTTIRLYVNGTQVATKAVSGSINSSTAPLRFGGDSVWGEYFNGLIDEVRVYSTVLTAAQITSDMNTPVGGGGGAQLADRPAAIGRHVAALSPAQVGPALRAALSLWAKAGVPAALLPAAEAIHVHLADLPGSGLGFTDAATDQIWLDQGAAGYGWSPARGGFDLRTVLAHEVGHLLGIADLGPGVGRPGDLMNQTIAPGEVRRPSALDARLATADPGRIGQTALTAPSPAVPGFAVVEALTIPSPGVFGSDGPSAMTGTGALFDRRSYQWDDRPAVLTGSIEPAVRATVDFNSGAPVAIAAAESGDEIRLPGSTPGEDSTPDRMLP
jgi:hypothetical protein